MNTVKQLVETIKEGIQEKKGQDIVIADLTEIDGSIRFIENFKNRPR
jgi:ribosome-associated protein